ncbi:MAG: sulfatase family protein [Thermoguttaceae bacterium]
MSVFLSTRAALPVVLLAGLCSCCLAPAADRPANLVLILTDNHGAWTLGCYGNPDIRTPHIDRLAAEGTLFERCYSSNAVCSPTRATLLTGLMPSQHGVHCFLGAGGVQIGPGAYNTLEEIRSLPEILADAGYACGLTGKWHLGDNLHPHERFSYWVTMPHGATSEFYDAQVIENGQLRTEPQYLTDFWTDHAVRFIEQNRDRPFFLYLPYNGPYGLGNLLNAPARNRHAEYYADKDLWSFPRGPVHPWLFNNRQFINNVQAMRRYAAEISGVDDGVGRVLETLARLGLDEDTLVVFTGDQGLSGGQNHVWGMGDHCRPLQTFDSTMHVPLIYRRTGRIPAGVRSPILTSNYDILPTVLSCLGLGDRLPADPPRPGRDYSAVLRGQPLEHWEDVVFYEFENCRTLRTSEWKYTMRHHPEGPVQLFRISDDPGELDNLAGRPGFEQIEAELAKRVDDYFGRYSDPKYDLYHGGGSKSLLLTREKK